MLLCAAGLVEIDPFLKPPFVLQILLARCGGFCGGTYSIRSDSYDLGFGCVGLCEPESWCYDKFGYYGFLQLFVRIFSALV